MDNDKNCTYSQNYVIRLSLLQMNKMKDPV